MAQVVSILLSQELLALERAVGELRRRNLPIESITVGPGEAPGTSCLTVILSTDEAGADMTAKKLNKLSGVRDVKHFPLDDGVAREVALIKLGATMETSTPGGGAISPKCTLKPWANMSVLPGWTAPATLSS